MRHVKDVLETLLTRVCMGFEHTAPFISAVQYRRSIEVMIIASLQVSMRCRSHSNLLLHFEPSESRCTFPACHRAWKLIITARFPVELPRREHQGHVFFAFLVGKSGTSQLFLKHSSRAGRSMNHDSTSTQRLIPRYEIR
jgi:hypothetical protein